MYDYRFVDDPVQAVLQRLQGVKQSGPNQWQARCPSHEDRRASLSIGRGGDGRALIDCKAGCPAADVLACIGLELKDLYPPKPNFPAQPAKANKGKDRASKGNARIVATYSYRAADGELLYQVVRFDPKDFRQRRPNGRGGWVWKLGDVPRVLYRLPELLTGDPTAWIFVCEGEKDVDNLAALGLLATTCPGGAGKWGKLADDSALHGRRVAIIPDLDQAGAAHAQDVAARLHGNASVVKIVDLPPGEVNGKPMKDVSDWLDRLDCRTPEELTAALVEMAESAPDWTPGEGGPMVPASYGPLLTSLADVTPVEVRWLWPARIATGKLTLIAGDPGLGKSFITLDMAARVSRGTSWPDCPHAENPVGGVVLLSAEDDLADTIRPRLDAAGADVGRIQALEAVRHYDFESGSERHDTFTLAGDLPVLEQAVQQVEDCRLVIIDPISAYIGRTDSHKNTDVRGLLKPLSELAARHSVAVVAVTHLRKGEGPAIYRSMGSLAFVAAARAAYAVTKDKDDPSGERRLVLPVKNNLGNDRTGLAYTLDGTCCTNGHAVVLWEADPVEISADEALCPEVKRADVDTTALDEAKDWLQNTLAEGPLPAKVIFNQARNDGIARRTLYRAKKSLWVCAFKQSFGGGWVWKCGASPAPADPPATDRGQECQAPPQETLAAFGNLGNLGPETHENAVPWAPAEGDSFEDCQVGQAGNLQTGQVD